MVVTPDGKWATTLYARPPQYLIEEGLGFYPLKSLSASTKPLFVDGALGGFYQSVALVGKQGKQTHYRVSVQEGDDSGNYFVMRDYVDPPARNASVAQLKEFLASSLTGQIATWNRRAEEADFYFKQESQNPGPNSKEAINAKRDSDHKRTVAESLRGLAAKFNSAHDRREIEDYIRSMPEELEGWSARIKTADYAADLGPPKRMCGNYPPNSLKTAIMSRDGMRVAAKVVDEDSTVVFQLDPATGTCTPELDLHRATGKADFSPDGKRLAFHLQKPIDGDPVGWIQVPHETMQSPAYVYDFETGATTEVTKGMPGNFLYPSFFANGDLGVVRFTHPNGRVKADFVVFDLRTTKSAACVSGSDKEPGGVQAGSPQ